MQMHGHKFVVCTTGLSQRMLLNLSWTGSTMAYNVNAGHGVGTTSTLWYRTFNVIVGTWLYESSYQKVKNLLDYT